MDLAALRNRLRDDLRQEFRGQLLIDSVSRTLYSTDASLFQVEPLAVALPRNDDDLRTLIRYAYERSIPIVPRGAGTGLAGESLGAGIAIDLSVHFRSILGMGDDWVRVQAGVVLNRLNAELAKIGRRFAPNPASSASCTIGGMIATDASGSRATRHGCTRDHVRGMKVVWDDGTLDRLESIVLPLETAQPRTRELHAGLRNLLTTNAEAIATNRPRTPFNRCGYRLDEHDLTRFLVGSEGTLGVVTEATLRTIPLPGGRAGVSFGFTSFEAALHASLVACTFDPAACEVLDRRLVSVARTHADDTSAFGPTDLEAVLLVEFEADTPTDAREAVQSLIRHLNGATSVVMADTDREMEDIWAVRSAALPALYAQGRGSRPLPFVEDMGVSPTDLPEFVAKSKEILKRFDVAASYLVHAATGQVHLRPILDPNDGYDAAKLWPLADELHKLAIGMGGTISAQHGTGLARTPWVERQYPELIAVFRDVKQLFDPRGILNPGKIVGPDPSRPAWPLRSTPIPSGPEPAATALPSDAVAMPDVIPDPIATPQARATLLIWAEDEMSQAVAACNGCGACRTEDTGSRMCPTFRATNVEAATPRAKANLFRSIVQSGGLGFGDDAIRAVADLCVNCKMCAQECPSRVDIPKLMLEAKAANHAAHGLRRSMWFQARIDGLAAIGSRMSPIANLLLGRPLVRRGLEILFGLARGRTLPAFAFRPFLRRARRRGLNRRPTDGPAVALFVDTFANMFDPSIAEAAVAVLQHNGVPVYVPAHQRGTGAMALAQGDTEIALERLRYNVRHLADAARAGDTIVCPEPTAALFFRLDALGLSDDPDVKLVASRTVELTSYLWALHDSRRLRTDFQPLPMSLGHHVPCHVKALGDGIRGPGLLSLIPQLQVSKIDLSCSGMAGTYGLNVRNLPTSLAAGRPMLDELARPDHQFGSSECSACRLQMQQGTGKRALHPIQYMALAYGLMPSLADRLRKPFGGRVCS